ncbi:hypothetical protein QU481_05980 [Crenobacter sp. SG2303]|uniref:Uncharacterized protein n=1 Tax=Crenobacter oryzisoli TaxID=3056844 RepID=A0ABT7XKZ3_9NEIS|nr:MULTISPECIES: hypothetical protein [unclassified Crenobacter]MDN0074443.1 hypothetical protein [Crenobacter sp. SG2303]MDN0081300.1 hypothetical protein [Crenobacter sp. SG2305]
MQEAIRNGDISPDDARQSRRQEQERWQQHQRDQQDRPAFDEGRDPSRRGAPSNRWRDRLRDNYQRD